MYATMYAVPRAGCDPRDLDTVGDHVDGALLDA
jgi:hypothetical protein